MKKIFLIASIVFLFNTALANVFDSPVKLENITKQMPKMGSIKCTFKQEKNIKNLSKPLISSGDFEFIQGKGVYFHTKYPVQNEVNYTSEKYKQINDIVSALSSKKYSKLEKDFDFYYLGNINNWTLGMKPKKSSDAYNYISSITINGKENIDKIAINQTNGNNTTIWFEK